MMATNAAWAGLEEEVGNFETVGGGDGLFLERKIRELTLRLLASYLAVRATPSMFWYEVPIPLACDSLDFWDWTFGSVEEENN